MRTITETIAYLRREIERCKARVGPEWNWTRVRMEEMTLQMILDFIEEN